MTLTRRHRFKQLPVMDPGTKGDLWQRGDATGRLAAIAGPAGHDGYVLSWNDTTGLWEPRAAAGGGGSLATLSDANISSPANLDLLQYQTSDNKWHNVATISAAKIGSGTLAQARGGTGIDTSAATDGQVLIGKTSDGSLNLHTLDAGTGITITNTGGRISIAASGGAGPGGTVPNWIAYHPFNPPSSPDSHNDEFDSSTLDASWTETVTGSPTHDIDTTVRSHLYVRINSNGDIYTIKKTAPDATADFSMTALFYHTAQQSIGSDQTLLFAASSGNDAVYAKWANGNVTLMSQDTGTFTDRASSAWDRNTFGLIHLQRTGNVWSVYVSQDGKAFRLAGGTTFTKSFTVATVGLQIQGSGGVTIYGAGLRRAIDFFRYKWLTL